MKTRVIVGLGNPGIAFKDTYHNAGMLAVQYLAGELEKEGVAVEWKTHKKLFSYAVAHDLALILPLTFMNESGMAVKEAMKKFSAEAEDLTVVHDESDLAVGTYKVSVGRNAAGHKGILSIMAALGTKDFTRIRIGIRRPNPGQRKKASDFVLKKITAADRKSLDTVFGTIATERIRMSS
jgi:PTH1 family peptidyl-tRNA hydrolase